METWGSFGVGFYCRSYLLLHSATPSVSVDRSKSSKKAIFSRLYPIYRGAWGMPPSPPSYAQLFERPNLWSSISSFRERLSRVTGQDKDRHALLLSTADVKGLCFAINSRLCTLLFSGYSSIGFVRLFDGRFVWIPCRYFSRPARILSICNYWLEPFCCRQMRRNQRRKKFQGGIYSGTKYLRENSETMQSMFYGESAEQNSIRLVVYFGAQWVMDLIL